ncbi:unnamed protein product [Spirodela intermedia]|uniref:Uncharacterized protein n=1 Tax=Spirodela intermedia TaxID=51605 RepID=A0A7I8IU48_SPIIN|nr:unnamed protein product [Spirodela intermedia]CAA6661485.1 unnamed protein product [Spirodela intermedia]
MLLLLGPPLRRRELGPSSRRRTRVGAWERIGGAAGDAGGAAASTAPIAAPWWRRALTKVREWSEIVAGPRWKTLIRRFNRSRRWCGGARAGKFHYDPMSYALNFDDGRGGRGRGAAGDDGEDGGYPNFSARFVLAPSLGKTSVDLGGRNAPALVSSG